MEQTAVEWFEKELQKNFNIEGVQPLYDDLFEQAKEMEKQQIIDGAKWQQDKNKYSEEQLKAYGEFCVAKFNGFDSVSLNNDVFEQFKKK